MSEARPVPSFSRALVTGATGFLGEHLCARLVACGVTTASLVRPASAEITIARLRKDTTVISTDGSTKGLAEALETARPDIVFHLAAKYIATHGPEDITTLVADNVELTAKLCEALSISGCERLVSAGTAWQHAGSPSGDTTPFPNTLYAATKQAADEMIDYYARATGLHAITLKIYDSYGPGDPRRKFLNVLAETAARGETLRASPGDQKLHTVHVDDIIDGFVHAGNLLHADEISGRHSFTLPSPKAITLQDLAETWKTATGSDARIEWGAMPHRPGEVMIPWEGTALPGWSARIALEDGLRALQA
jgi:nucleoside-diphosphate-sugar epimerase